MGLMLAQTRDGWRGAQSRREHHRHAVSVAAPSALLRSWTDGAL
jgi:hypothetical protein